MYKTYKVYIAGTFDKAEELVITENYINTTEKTPSRAAEYAVEEWCERTGAEQTYLRVIVIDEAGVKHRFHVSAKNYSRWDISSNEVKG